MPQPKLFMSSISRRDLARRRPGRSLRRRPISSLSSLLFLVLVIAIGLGAFMAGHGGL